MARLGNMKGCLKIQQSKGENVYGPPFQATATRTGCKAGLPGCHAELDQRLFFPLVRCPLQEMPLLRTEWLSTPQLPSLL